MEDAELSVWVKKFKQATSDAQRASLVIRIYWKGATDQVLRETINSGGKIYLKKLKREQE